ncbi:MAG TPA: N-formylglutamate amidohydrolase [Gammaproteobacteria bacterium]|nr:N-formylglutamate amidohydrolase [Gammaproteobacteria bacterium]
MMTDVSPFKVREPTANEVRVVVSIPHTGTYVPGDIAANFASDSIRALPMTDWHLHHLYDFLPRLGVTTLYATWSRFVADLNRPPRDQPLYPGRFETGIVADKTFWGDAIWKQSPDAAEVGRRKRLVHEPYHDKLAELLEAKRKRFGRIVLIDAHSVASRASLLHGELEKDIYLGNRDGRSSDNWLIDHVAEQFRGADLKVSYNDPYKGGYITDHYGQIDGIEALQIEMCERLYMDEDNPQAALSNPKFEKMRGVLRDLFASLLLRVEEKIGG